MRGRYLGRTVVRRRQLHRREALGALVGPIVAPLVACAAPGLDPSDWHLTGPGASLAIDAGYTGVAAQIDFENAVRTADNRLDIGALESDGAPPAEPDPGLAPPVLLD